MTLRCQVSNGLIRGHGDEPMRRIFAAQQKFDLPTSSRSVIILGRTIHGAGA
jgi:hypothetical protein